MEVIQKSILSLEMANQLIDKAIHEAKIKGFSIVASVVNPEGSLIALQKMDHALAGPLDVAIKKARTAALFGHNSSELGKLAQPGQSLYSIEHTNDGLVSFGGGITLFYKNEVIGGLGVAGASVEEDEKIAQTAYHSFITTN